MKATAKSFRVRETTTQFEFLLPAKRVRTMTAKRASLDQAEKQTSGVEIAAHPKSRVGSAAAGKLAAFDSLNDLENNDELKMIEANAGPIKLRTFVTAAAKKKFPKDAVSVRIPRKCKLFVLSFGDRNPQTWALMNDDGIMRGFPSGYEVLAKAFGTKFSFQVVTKRNVANESDTILICASLFGFRNITTNFVESQLFRDKFIKFVEATCENLNPNTVRGFNVHTYVGLARKEGQEALKKAYPNEYNEFMRTRAEFVVVRGDQLLPPQCHVLSNNYLAEVGFDALINANVTAEPESIVAHSAAPGSVPVIASLFNHNAIGNAPVSAALVAAAVPPEFLPTLPKFAIDPDPSRIVFMQLQDDEVYGSRSGEGLNHHGLDHKKFAVKAVGWLNRSEHLSTRDL